MQAGTGLYRLRLELATGRAAQLGEVVTRLRGAARAVIPSALGAGRAVSH
jgi:hypothetical protein